MDVKQLKFKLAFIMNYLSVAALFKYGLLACIIFIYALSTVNIDIPLYSIFTDSDNTLVNTNATVMHASLKN